MDLGLARFLNEFFFWFRLYTYIYFSNDLFPIVALMLKSMLLFSL